MSSFAESVRKTRVSSVSASNYKQMTIVNVDL
jgi:hypothetical protein